MRAAYANEAVSLREASSRRLAIDSRHVGARADRMNQVESRETH